MKSREADIHNLFLQKWHEIRKGLNENVTLKQHKIHAEYWYKYVLPGDILNSAHISLQTENFDISPSVREFNVDKFTSCKFFGSLSLYLSIHLINN
jgi:hypothetical protein